MKKQLQNYDFRGRLKVENTDKYRHSISDLVISYFESMNSLFNKNHEFRLYGFAYMVPIESNNAHTKFFRWIKFRLFYTSTAAFFEVIYWTVSGDWDLYEVHSCRSILRFVHITSKKISSVGHSFNYRFDKAEVVICQVVILKNNTQF